jgi:hypothetical protein
MLCSHSDAAVALRQTSVSLSRLDVCTVRCSNSGEQHAGQLKAVIVLYYDYEAAVAEIAASPDKRCVTACATMQQSWQALTFC